MKIMLNRAWRQREKIVEMFTTQTNTNSAKKEEINPVFLSYGAYIIKCYKK